MTDLYEELWWGEDTKADGKKGPAMHTALPVPVVHQLLTDLAVNLIPTQTEQHPNQNHNQNSCMCPTEETFTLLQQSTARHEEDRTILYKNTFKIHIHRI